MSVLWYREPPNQEDDLRRALAQAYPDLTLTLSDGEGVLEGSFPVIFEDYELSRFSVRIQIPKTFPQDIPVVFDAGDRIPRTANWHMFSDGSLCVMVPELWLVQPQSNSLVAFLEGPLRNFFIGHVLAEAGQPRPMGERDHGAEGLFQAYGELVQATDRRAIEKYLDFCQAKKLKLHWKCPCGSGRRVSICHLGHVVDLRKRIPGWIAKKAFDRLTSHLGTDRQSGPQSSTSVAA